MTKEKIIAVGALGGSGTRAVAEILISAGIFLGDDLNDPNDNLDFTRLFKNPIWFKKAKNTEINKRFEIFQKIMERKKLTLKEFYILYKAAYNNPTYKTNLKYYIDNIKKNSNLPEKSLKWGWKEPNTLIYLAKILKFFPSLKYVHVLRHGLDMAFSNNKQQLFYWGWKYGINITGEEDGIEITKKQLDYWIKTTKEVIALSEIDDERILIVNHSNLCDQPEEEIDKLLKFCELHPDSTVKKELYKIPKNTGSNNRYKLNDIKVFSSKQLDFIKQMGFAIN